MNITIFNEYHPDHRKGKALKSYPMGIHEELKKIFKDNSYEVTVANQEAPSNGLTNEILQKTDVLIWWSDLWNEQILSDVAVNVYNRVIEGMGIIFLYKSYASKPFQQLMGTNCKANSITTSTSCKIHTIRPHHPILSNVKSPFSFQDEKIVSEPFTIPNPDELICLAGFTNGEVLRAGCTFTRGKGKIFYFYGGSELGNSFNNTNIKRIIFNATNWVAQSSNLLCEDPIEELKEPPKKTFRFWGKNK